MLAFPTMPSPTANPIAEPCADAAAVAIRRRGGDSPLPADPEALLGRLYQVRGAAADALGAAPLAGLHPAGALKDIDRATNLLAGQIERRGRILVVGDYDADGATGSALAMRGLRALGAARVEYLVPSRFAFGYGLSPAVVDAAAPRRPDLILTVDNGISSLSGVVRAGELGIPVLVTDHHLPGERLPAAGAIVNPNQPGCPFPSKHLAGVGVVFYLLAALRARLREAGWFGPSRPEPNLAELLDLVALGTVADVVTLDANNRILVEQGLRRIRAGRGAPGVRALLTVAGRDPARATARDLGFYAGPRLNAAGRLTEMSLGVECLLSDDPAAALAMARELDALNRRRREIETAMREEAEALLDRVGLEGAALPPGLCVFAPGWHQGVTGILAGRLRERYHRPVIAFADVGDGRLGGSARSLDGLHMRDLIAAIDGRHPGLIERFGGHAMAAGLTLKGEALAAFRAAFEAEVRRELGDDPPLREVLSDGELPTEALSLPTAEMLRIAGPWGKGFPEPLFDGRFGVEDARVVGGHHLKLRLRALGGLAVDAIAFRQGSGLAAPGAAVHLAYRLDVNEYQGSRSAQLIVEHLRPAGPRSQA